MSDYYRIHCLDCDEQDYESRSNWGHDGQVEAIKHREVLVRATAIADWPLEIEITCHGRHVDVAFLERHMQHRLVSMSEYRTTWYDSDGTMHQTAMDEPGADRDAELGGQQK